MIYEIIVEKQPGRIYQLLDLARLLGVQVLTEDKAATHRKLTQEVY